ncbi:MAG: SUMF1/EgtB/PvdO family nonheme iron enzyme [Chloroflexota bacterium]
MKLNRSNLLTLIWLLIPLVYLLGSVAFQQLNPSPPEAQDKSLVTPTSEPIPLAKPTVKPTLDLTQMIFIPHIDSGNTAGGESDIKQVGFYIDQYETTVTQYVAYLNVLIQRMPDCQHYHCLKTSELVAYEPTDLYFQGERFHVSAGAENRPIMGITWAMADAYCRWREKRLPTNEEWLQAARGPDRRSYPWGQEWHPSWADRLGLASTGKYALPVGSNPNDVTAYGVYDMLGSANEWVVDWGIEANRPDSSFANPTGSGTDLPHINRGLYGREPKVGFDAQSIGPNPYVGVRCTYDQ